MKIIILTSWAYSLVDFRGSLIAEIARNGHSVIACAPEADRHVAEQVRRLGAIYEPVKMQRTGMNPIRDILTIRTFKELFRRYEPDVLISYMIKPVIYGSLAARSAGVNKIISVITGLGYTLQSETPTQKLLGIAVKRMYKRSLQVNNIVFFLNPDDRQFFVESGFVSKKQTALINGEGVDLDYYCLAKPVTEPVSFLLIARLLKDKGIMEYVEAAKIVKKSHPKTSFQLLGPLDSNPTAISKTTVDEWHKAGVIEYLGESDDVRPYIASTSVFVLPSYREGTPRSVLEAMSMGRPIVTTDAPGCRETVIDGINGFLVPPRDSVSLAAAMKRFIDEKNLVTEMGARSRELAEKKYDVHKVNAVILKAMGLACSEPSSSPV